MKKLLFAVVAALTVATVLADEIKKPNHRRPSRPSGGIIEKAYAGKVFRVLNTQTDYTGDKLLKLTRTIRYASLLPIECRQATIENGKSPFAIAEDLVANNGVGAGALVVNDPKLPIFVISPDRRWGILNIATFKSDNPSDELFEKRFTKAYWNIIARSLGAGTSSYPGCVLVPFSDMKELDAIITTKPCPEPFNKMMDTCKVYGIGTISIATYRTACQQGWAPAPTNDVQKAIWDEVHAIPKNPMKIEFDPKKGR